MVWFSADCSLYSYFYRESTKNTAFCLRRECYVRLKCKMEPYTISKKLSNTSYFFLTTYFIYIHANVQTNVYVHMYVYKAKNERKYKIDVAIFQL